jgi:hypothetical protein
LRHGNGQFLQIKFQPILIFVFHPLNNICWMKGQTSISLLVPFLFCWSFPFLSCSFLPDIYSETHLALWWSVYSHHLSVFVSIYYWHWYLFFGYLYEGMLLWHVISARMKVFHRGQILFRFLKNAVLLGTFRLVKNNAFQGFGRIL